MVASKNGYFDFSLLKKKKFITVRDAISDLAYLNSGEGEEEEGYKNPALSAYQKALRGKKLYNHKASNHSPLALKKLKLIPPKSGKEFLPKKLHGKQLFKGTWSRLEWDGVSPTIDTRFDTPSNGKNSHPFLHRSITPREVARIQGFDDDFRFLGGIMLFNEDCLKMAKNFDAIINDPPYNISKKNNFSSLKNKRQGVDFGPWDKNFDPCKWIKLYAPLVKKNGCMIIFCSYFYVSFIIKVLDDCGFETKDLLRWQKSNPMPRNVLRRYVSDCEFALWAVRKGAKWTFNKPHTKPYLRALFKSYVVSGREKLPHGKWDDRSGVWAFEA